MGMVGSVAMGLPWKGRGRGSVCWVGSLDLAVEKNQPRSVGSDCGRVFVWEEGLVLPWKGKGREELVEEEWHS